MNERDQNLLALIHLLDLLINSEALNLGAKSFVDDNMQYHELIEKVIASRLEVQVHQRLHPYISLNPYRIIGVHSNSGVKEIHKNLSKLKAYAQLDKKVEFDYDFNFLNLVEVERNNEIISKVESRILLDENKVKYSLFWFLDASSYDSIALSNLIKSNTEKAIGIWEKAIKSNEVTSKNYSAFNNLATLLILLSLDDSKSDLFSKSKDSIHNLRQALNYKCALMSSDFFKNFCNEIGVTTVGANGVAFTITSI
jgi:tetratricopeptide (TPR) repeat protein